MRNKKKINKQKQTNKQTNKQTKQNNPKSPYHLYKGGSSKNLAKMHPTIAITSQAKETLKKRGRENFERRENVSTLLKKHKQTNKTKQKRKKKDASDSSTQTQRFSTPRRRIENLLVHQNTMRPKQSTKHNHKQKRSKPRKKKKKKKSRQRQQTNLLQMDSSFYSPRESASQQSPSVRTKKNKEIDFSI